MSNAVTIVQEMDTRVAKELNITTDVKIVNKSQTSDDFKTLKQAYRNVMRDLVKPTKLKESNDNLHTRL